MVTAVSPCVLPVLPIVFAGAASGGPRRPYAIVAGLVVSFTVFTLAAATLLRAVGLPEDFFRNLAIAVLFVVAASLVWEPLGQLLQRPFLALGRRPPGDAGGGFLLGLNLGLLFTPCAGPVTAVLMVLGLDRDLATRVPEYTRALQGLEESAEAQSELDALVGRKGAPIE